MNLQESLLTVIAELRIVIDQKDTVINNLLSQAKDKDTKIINLIKQINNTCEEKVD